MTSKGANISDACFIVLALLSEGKTHGYELEKVVQNRGFRFWTNLGRSSIYGSLKILEKNGFVKTSLEQEGGPARKMFKITKEGKEVLRQSGMKHLAEPSHWRSEIDLGLYSLPSLSNSQVKKAINRCLENLEIRLEFITERYKWCQSRQLLLPALSFQRTMMMLEAEIKWLKVLKTKALEVKGKFTYNDWQGYIYKEPPLADTV